MNGEIGVKDAQLGEDSITKALFKEEPDSDLQGMTCQALELLSCAIPLILEHQCKDQLPGG